MNSVISKVKLLTVLMLVFIVLVIVPSSAKSIRPTPEEPSIAAIETKPSVSANKLSEEWQFFRINAQYRGTVKKSFSNLGCAIAWFKDLTPDQTQVIIHVSALHPEKRQQKYSFRLNLVLKREGARFSLVKKEYADFTGITGDRQTQLQQLAALWAYMRAFAYEGKLFSDFEACDAKLKLSEAVRRKGLNREIDCNWPGRRSFYGKFFFERHVNPVFKDILELDKLRFKSGKLSISLVKDSQESVTRDFGSREPFATDVFK